MGVSAGPNISRDGLTLYYDLSNSNSFRGEATTNLVNPDWTTWSLDASGFTTVGTRTIISTYYIRITDVNANARHNTWVYSLSGNTIYTFSVKYRRIVGTPTLRFQIQFYNGGSYLGIFFPTTAQIGIVDSGDWQTATYTVTTPATTDRVLWFIQDGDDYVGYTHTFELKEAQAEAKAYATAFVVGTRGTTVATGGGVIDLTRRGFDGYTGVTASATDLFANLDGVDDSIVGPLGSSIGAIPEHAFEIWFKTPGLGQNMTRGGLFAFDYGMVVQIVTDGNLSYLLYNTDTPNDFKYIVSSGTSGINLFDNNWHHVICTRNNTNYAIYIDGILRASGNGGGSWSGLTIWSSAMNIVLGNNPNDSTYKFKGSMSSFKLYKKYMTATEALQNYNASKNKYITRISPVSTSLILSLDAGNISSYKGSGTAWNDLSGYGNNATLTNGPKFRGESGGTITLDGLNDYIVISKNSNFYTSSWTWEFFIRFNSNTGTYQGIVWAEGAVGGGSGYQYLFSVYNNTYFHYRIYNSVTGWANTDTSNIDFSLTRYNHIVWQFNSGTTTIYVNGALWHTNSTRGSYNGGSDSPMYIGSRNDVAYPAPISMGVCKFYNRVLSASEILQNYNSQKTRFGF
jgi:hypothetical protein